MIGSVISTTRDPLPDYLLLCDGSNYSGDDFPELYAIIGDEFKLGDGTFSVPNLQGKFVLGDLPPDLIEGLEFIPGDSGGEYEHTLTVDELAVHTHIQNAHNHTQDAHNHTQNAHNHTQDAHNHGVPSVNNGAIGANPILLRSNAAAGINTNTTSTTATNQAATATNQAATATNQAATATNQDTGGGIPHNNMPPYVVLRYAIIAR